MVSAQGSQPFTAATTAMRSTCTSWALPASGAFFFVAACCCMSFGRPAVLSGFWHRVLQDRFAVSVALVGAQVNAGRHKRLWASAPPS
ncbi:hypothetical protein BG36_07440 [Aquamicrobium defluvii]|uniref:Uncharacterized protein n=1 Tax=Aquamicrobium defluvii TaxID=69279 RepID=A0A011TN40_9HYPH|nr:hypothetical protein BG36_07440 [Aquamicrobium defluvii]